MARLVERYVQSKVNVILEMDLLPLGEDGVLKAVKLQDGTEIPCDFGTCCWCNSQH